MTRVNPNQQPNQNTNSPRTTPTPEQAQANNSARAAAEQHLKSSMLQNASKKINLSK